MKLRLSKRPFNLTLGQRGEMAAWKFLKNAGYKILHKNFRAPMGEVDVIAEKNKRLIFLEVKTRSSMEKGAPEEAVGSAKQKKLVQLAAFYLKKNKKENARIGFEVLAVLWPDSGAPEFKLIENAFEVQGEF